MFPLLCCQVTSCPHRASLFPGAAPPGVIDISPRVSGYSPPSLSSTSSFSMLNTSPNTGSIFIFCVLLCRVLMSWSRSWSRPQSMLQFMPGFRSVPCDPPQRAGQPLFYKASLPNKRESDTPGFMEHAPGHFNVKTLCGLKHCVQTPDRNSLHYISERRPEVEICYIIDNERSVLEVAQH